MGIRHYKKIVVTDKHELVVWHQTITNYKVAKHVLLAGKNMVICTCIVSRKEYGNMLTEISRPKRKFNEN